MTTTITVTDYGTDEDALWAAVDAAIVARDAGNTVVLQGSGDWINDVEGRATSSVGPKFPYGIEYRDIWLKMADDLAGTVTSWRDDSQDTGTGTTILRRCKVDGNKDGKFDEHWSIFHEPYQSYQHGHGFRFANTYPSQIEMYDCEAIDCAGDGIYVGEGVPRLTIERFSCSGCLRGGIVVAGNAGNSHVIIRDCDLSTQYLDTEPVSFGGGLVEVYNSRFAQVTIQDYGCYLENVECTDAPPFGPGYVTLTANALAGATELQVDDLRQIRFGTSTTKSMERITDGEEAEFLITGSTQTLVKLDSGLINPLSSGDVLMRAALPPANLDSRNGNRIHVMRSNLSGLPASGALYPRPGGTVLTQGDYVEVFRSIGQGGIKLGV